MTDTNGPREGTLKAENKMHEVKRTGAEEEEARLWEAIPPMPGKRQESRQDKRVTAMRSIQISNSREPGMWEVRGDRGIQ